MNKKGYFVKTDKIIVKNEDVRAISYVKCGSESYQIVTVRKDSILVICTVKDRRTKEEKKECLGGLPRRRDWKIFKNLL